MAGRTSSRVLLSGLVGLLLSAGALPPGQGAPPPDDAARFTSTPLAPTGTVTGTKSVSGRLARTDPGLLARTDAEPVTVMIKLDHDAAASYTGGVRGLAATSPARTGAPLTGESHREKAYEAFQQEREEAVVAALTEAVPSARVGQRLRTVYGGIAATVPADAVETILEIDGVAAVQQDSRRQLLTDSSPEFINAPPLYADLGGTTNAGEGVVYGNLDTGVWPEHPSFADLGHLKPPPGPARVCDFGDNPLTPTEDPFTCQNKLIGGHAFLATYLSDPDRAAAEPYHSARDSNGHGTHTASTSAGNVVEDVSVVGSDLPPVHGVAPGAWVMEYKVCGIQGCFDSDSAAAVGQAVLDGVDVINFSISGGSEPFSDPVELAFLDAYAAGVLVSASAGNSGPGASTADHLSPWVTTVGASTQTRELATTVTLRSTDGATLLLDGASITSGVPERPVVLASAPPYDDPLCQAPAPPGAFTGVIVACQTGVNARAVKGYNVLQGGAAAMILFSPGPADAAVDSHWLPTVHLADGTDLLAFVQAHPDVTGSFPAGRPRTGQGDVMATFSSRGPGGLFLKPDVTAPGKQIVAGTTPTPDSLARGPRGEYFQALQGTSMSSPHVAGAALLLRASHPAWTPGQVKSALMTTATTDVVKEDGETAADPFDMGAGRIDVGESADVPFTLDETADRFLDLAGDPVQAVHLNLPSVNAPVMPGRLHTTRVLTSTSDRPVLVAASADAPEGSAITVNPRVLTLRPGGTATLDITIESDAPTGEQQFGAIHLEALRGDTLHLPVAFVPTQGEVTLTQSCEPESVPLNGEATCTVEAVNTSFDDQLVRLDSTVDRPLRVTGADGATVTGPRSARLDVTLEEARLGVPSVAPGAGSAGYLPLDELFGVTPIPVGDEAFVNLNVPPFRFNGQTFSAVGVNSNGYLVAGGGTSEDNNCCTLPDGPDPAPPNNVLAPFWTDLDGTDAPGILATMLTDGESDWVVVEYRLNVWGTDDGPTFQVWLGTTGDATPEQDVSFAYDPDDLPTDPAGQDYLVGAENAAGEGDMEEVLPTADLVVTSTDPAPGGTARYAFTVRGVETGTGQVTTELSGAGLPGVTVVRSQVPVTRR